MMLLQEDFQYIMFQNSMKLKLCYFNDKVNKFNLNNTNNNNYQK
jgi:hypothetical protein